ncbi:sugar efflux transporter [Erwinia aphidicola]|uniref:sugar efflux transporter n=1 Tax=Erwinia aphidicola TaxID=68334 RepID=UPI00209E6763|nr:sugar efflux transporter [Erwinia aphidicola]MCP2229744.1 SET family sugar efflux transporter-like MFS transporter [Erwinia aphidicola]
MQIPAAPSRTLPGNRSLAFLVVAFISGLAGALQTPTLSLFLTSEVQVRPFMVGLFFTFNAVIGILVSQLLARYSDRKGDRKTLILYCCLLGALASLLFAWNRSYFVLLLVGVLLSSFGSSATSQMFALAREHADKTGRESVMFSSVMRAQISLAWMIGPPLAFALALGYGFRTMYLTAAIAFVLCAVIVRYLLPSMRKKTLVTAMPVQAPRQHRRATLTLFIACTLMWSCNGLYLITMPLYVVNELHLPEKLAGIMMGLAAGLEIPIMLLAGYYARRFGKRLLMRIAAVAGLLFYAGTLLFDGEMQMLVLQGLNAVFIGILAGIGMIYFQDMMPGQAGAATTLFTNSTRMGWIVGGALAGAVAQFWSYHGVLWFAVVMMAAAIACLLRVPEPKVQSCEVAQG